ncbi:MAG TPA: hypothetical protein VIE35_01715 [Dongiaceae bacterium]|jgi:hypothetical protein
MLKKKLMRLGWLALGLGGLIAAAQPRPAVAAPCCSTCEPRYEACAAACAPGDSKCQLACTDRLNSCDRQCNPGC